MKTENKKYILIVDDEEVNREILKEMFRDDKYELTEAVNGEEAVSRLKEKSDFDLVLLDIVMPIMDGFGVLQFMHEQEMLDEIPVILITSEDALDSEDQAYSYGVADVIHKPFYPHIVKRRPVKRPKRMESRWISVVISRSRQGSKLRVPVHRPADMLSTDRARPSSAASFLDRTAGEA